MRLTTIFAGMLALTASFAVADVASAQMAKPEKTDVKIAVGGKSFMIYLPLSVTEALGYFKDAGLNVDIEEVHSGSKSLQALVGGSVDATSGSYDHTIQVQAKGKTVTAVVLMGRYPGIVLALVKDKAKNYHGPKDLKGMKIGVTGPGSQTNFMVDYIMAKAGLKPSAASFIGVGGPASAIAAVQHGELDAISHADPAITKLELAGAIKVIYDTRTTAGVKAVFGGEYPSSVLYVRPDFIKKNPNTTQALVTAIVRGLHWMQKATPAQIVALMAKHNNIGDKDLYLKIVTKSMPMFSPDGHLSRTGMENSYKVLSSFNASVAKAKIDIDATYTDRFVKKAQAAH